MNLDVTIWGPSFGIHRHSFSHLQDVKCNETSSAVYIGAFGGHSQESHNKGNVKAAVYSIIQKAIG